MKLDDERDAFLRSICATPADDAPRLIYADWLDEQGESEYATFIRDQIHLARLPKWHPDVLAVQWDNDTLLRYNSDSVGVLKLLTLPSGLYWSTRPMQRGFGASVQAATVEALRDGLATACQQAPINHLFLRARYREANTDLIAGLTQIPALAGIRRLEISLALLTPDHLQMLDACPYLTKLEVLELSFGGLSSRGAMVLPTLGLFRQLKELHLPSTDYGDPAGPAFAPAFQKHGAGSQLEVLNLRSNHFGPRDLAFLVASPALASVRELDLSECAYDTVFREEGYQALAASPYVQQLEVLHLSKTGPNLGGVQALAKAPFPNLRWLDLSNNNIGPKGIAALVAAPWFPQLTYLSLQGNPVKDSGLKQLLKASLPNLVALNLRDTNLTEAGMLSLTEAPFAGQLRQLNLFGNTIKKATTGQRLQAQFGDRVSFSGQR